MAIGAPVEYPTILTDKDWQKKKGLLAKAGGETGIGAQMDKIQADFKKVDWAVFYAKMVCSKQNGVLLPSHVDDKLKLVTQEYNKTVEPLRAEVNKLTKLAEKTAADWKKSKTIPSSSTKHVALVAAESDHFFMALKGNGIYFTQVQKDFQEEKDRLQGLVDIAARGIQKKISSLKEDGAELKKNPTVDQFKGGASSGFRQRIRGIGADLAMLSADPQIEQFRKNTWVKLTLDSYIPTSDDEVLGKLKEVGEAVKDLIRLLP